MPDPRRRCRSPSDNDLYRQASRRRISRTGNMHVEAGGKTAKRAVLALVDRSSDLLEGDNTHTNASQDVNANHVHRETPPPMLGCMQHMMDEIVRLLPEISTRPKAMAGARSRHGLPTGLQPGGWYRRACADACALVRSGEGTTAKFLAVLQGQHSLNQELMRAWQREEFARIKRSQPLLVHFECPDGSHPPDYVQAEWILCRGVEPHERPVSLDSGPFWYNCNTGCPFPLLPGHKQA